MINMRAGVRHTVKFISFAMSTLELALAILPVFDIIIFDISVLLLLEVELALVILHSLDITIFLSCL